MAINFYKVLGELPLELTTDSLYLVGVEEGTDLYVTSNTSAVPRRLANVKHLSDSLAPNVNEYHVGDVWTHPETLIKYELYQDSTKKIWIELGNAIASSDSDQSEEGGHVIIDGNDNIMPQRGNLKITGATVTDDAFNDSTKVTITVPTISQIPGLRAELDGLVNPSFENGLIEENGAVRLGGELAEDVGISLFGNRLSFSTNATPFDVSNSGIDGSVNTASFQSDGKILIGGEFTDYLKRLYADGPADSSFDTSGAGVVSSVYTVAFQPDGKILVGGEFTGYIKRLNIDGSVDADFNAASSGFDDPVYSIALQPDGKVLAGGDFTGYLKRLKSDGSEDTSFDASSAGFNSTVHSIIFLPDGGIMVGGSFVGGRIKRLKSDGTLDPSFDSSSSILNGTVYSIALQPDGKALVGGSFTGYLKRLKSDGSLDPDLNAFNLGINGLVRAISLQPDGRILVGGNFTGYIKRLNANGSVDTSFDTSGSGIDDSISTLDLQSNGKILIGGDFTGGVKHLNSDGTILNSGLIEYEGNYHDLYTNRTLVDKEYIDSKTSILSEKIEELKDRDAEFEIDLLKSEIQWKDDYIAIPHDAVIGNLDIEIIYCLAKTGQGVVHVSPTVSYPARPTKGGMVPKEFYLKDFNTLSKSKDIERLQIGYNVKPSLTSPYYVANVDTQRTIGRNIIFEEAAGESAHSSWMVRNFGGVYPDFTGERYQSRLLPEVMGHIDNLYEPTLCEKYKVNILTKPYVGGATQENVSSNPNILKVGAHFGNDNARHDITSSSEEFLSNVIAVTASNVAADTSDWASYGFGVEFFESFAKEEINARHPDKNIYDGVGQCYTTNGGFNLKSDVHPTTFSAALVGDKVYIRYSASNIAEREIAEVISTSEIRLTESTTAIASPGVTVYMYMTLGLHCRYKLSQSAACAIIAAKFRQIQDRTNANWQICREAARATASNSTFTTVGDKKVWATNWDMYRGFGIIDVNSAVEYIEQNYINNDDYKSSVVAAMPTINPFLSADDLEEDNYISKKMLSTAVNEITASNGLSRIENTVKLGGVLTEDTEVDLSSNRLAFSRNMPFVINSANYTSYIFTVLFQPDGKILVGGYFTGRIKRLNVDGSADSSFNASSSGFDDAVRAISFQPDGKILVGGSFTGYIKRLNSDGSVDTSFDVSGSGFNNVVYSVTIQPDGKILVGGDFIGRLKRLNPDGSVDTSFDAGSSGANTVRSIIFLPDGRLMVGGSFTGGMVKLFQPNGALDSSFNSSSSIPGGVVYSIALQPDGKILVGGSFTGNLKRLNSDGSEDTSFDVSNAGVNGNILAITLQPDGKILIGVALAASLIRLNPDGSVDTSFNASSLVSDIIVRTIALQSDGKILVGGDFTGRLIRLNSDGSAETENILSSGLNRGLLEHGDNYHDFYTSRTLVDKEYVDGRIVKANAEKTTPIIEGAVPGIGGVLSSRGLADLLESKGTTSYMLPNGYSFILINTSDNLKYLLTKVGGSFYQNLLTEVV